MAITSRGMNGMLGSTVEAMFKSRDQPAEVALKLRRPLECVKQLALVDLGRFGATRLVVMDVAGHELTEQLADRRLARRS